MNHRISAGALIVRDERILLVRHQKPSAYDFWVAPGGGVIGTETLAEAAKREVREETGLDVLLGELVMSKVSQPRHPALQILVPGLGGRGSGHDRWAGSPSRIHHRGGLAQRGRTPGAAAVPEVLRTRFWQDLKHGFHGLRHLGQRPMAFW